MNIYVGNLSSGITEEELRQEFINFGTVTSVALMSDKNIGSGQSRKCGYVEMPSENQGQAAIAHLQGKLLKGRNLTVIKALPITRANGYTITPGFSRKIKYH